MPNVGLYARITAIAVFLITPSLIAAQPLGFSLADNRKRVTIPIEIYNNLVIVPVELNGLVPMKFILDTGVRTAILTDKELADILGFTYSRKYVVSGLGGEKLVDAYITNNVSLDLPGVNSRGHAMLVLDQDHLELKNFLGADVQGILGYELFSRFIVDINYEKNRMTLMLPEKFRKKKKYDVLPISIEDTKPYLLADIKLNDSTSTHAKLLVDSGASHGLLLEPESDPLIQLPENNIESIIGRGIAGAIFGNIARIKSVTLGQYTIEDVVTNFPNDESYMFMDTLTSSSRVFRNGAIGGEVLSRFRVVFDFPSEKLYLAKNSSFGKEFYFNLSGLTIRATGSALDIFEIIDVRQHSPSYNADIQQGDIITSVNGYLSKNLEMNEVNGFLNARPGRKVIMELLRNGQRLRKEFVLESSI